MIAVASRASSAPTTVQGVCDVLVGRSMSLTAKSYAGQRARLRQSEPEDSVTTDAVPDGSPFVAPADGDRPTPPALRRKILLREAGRCANPHCGRPATHCHHVQFLAHGGRTVLSNELAVCGVCHALIHAGLLKVAGTPGADLRWTTRGDGLTARVRRATRAAGKLPVFRVEAGADERAGTPWTRRAVVPRPTSDSDSQPKRGPVARSIAS